MVGFGFRLGPGVDCRRSCGVDVTCAVTYTTIETHSGGDSARRWRTTMPIVHRMAPPKSTALQMIAGTSRMASEGTRSGWSLGPIEGNVRMAHAMQ